MCAEHGRQVEDGSPLLNLVEVEEIEKRKRVRREAGSERSVDQRYEPMNKSHEQQFPMHSIVQRRLIGR